MTVVAGREGWAVVTDSLEPGEELVRAEVRPGVWMKMKKKEAVARELYKEPKPRAQAKRRKRTRNKRRRPAEDKGARGQGDKGREAVEDE